MTGKGPFFILAINPGSTSTKLALYRDEVEVRRTQVDYSAGELAPFETMMDQMDLRQKSVERFLEEAALPDGALCAVVGRGGVIPPVKCGAYEVNRRMVDRLMNRPMGQHASNLGGVLAYGTASARGIPAYVYDGVSVGELEPLACLTGFGGLVRQSRCHALNMRAMAIRAARELGRDYHSLTLVVAHVGGGITLSIHRKGRMADVVLDGEGPMTPERAGRVPLSSLINHCMERGIDYKTLMKRIRGGGGLVSLLGTNSALEVERRIDGGDALASLAYETMAYQTAKSIGELATVASGRVDCIVLTGAVAHSRRFTRWVEERVRFIAPVVVLPGEDELEALALGGLRVLRGEEEARQYDERTDGWTMEAALEEALREYARGPGREEREEGCKMERQILLMSARDNVAIAVRELAAGARVELPGGGELVTAEKIPRSHKVALRDIPRGGPVLRYGAEIGYATRDIARGEWVHIHNLDAYGIM